MQEFFRLVYAQNLNIMFLSIVLAIFLWAYVTSRLENHRIILSKALNAVLFSIIIIVMIYRTIFSREAIHTDFELIPFKAFFTSYDVKAVIRSFYMNILLFVPLGLSMPYVLSKKPHKRNVFITIGFAAVLSAGIEFLQYYYHLGRCETDDVIANTLGAAVGTLSYCLYMKILKNQEKGSLMQKINNNQKLLLDLCAKSLFDKDITVPDELDSKALVEEAKRQTVFPIAYSLIKDKCDATDGKAFSQVIAKNIRVEYAHNEVHHILNENNIPYVILKGVASASYYKEPMLRMMGDVDVLVAPDNITKADKLLKSIGFVTTDDINGDDMHIGYKRKDGISCELHRRIGWIPKNDLSDVFHNYLDDIMASSIEYKTSNGSCLVPSVFYHGVVLLLHTATHLTHEGVGLRHLCDWAVFENGFSDNEFVSMFEKPLKEMGLWRFAQLLTICCIKCLGCEKKEWVGECDNALIDGIITDILNGGNFGYNDVERYKHIKYLNDRKEGTTSKKSTVLQALSSVNAKTKKDFNFVNKIKFLLPLGWMLTICKYLYMVLVGKRSLDNASTIKGAQNRKNIYEEFKLYQKDQDDIKRRPMS